MALGWQSVFSHALGDIDLANEVLGQSLAILDTAGPAGPGSVSLPREDTRLERAFVLRQMARMAHLSSVEEARQLLEQSLALYRGLDDRWAMANVLDELGAAAEQLALYDRAQALNEESLAIRRTLGDLGGIAHSLSQLGMVSRVQGELEAAERLFRESLVAYRDLGDRAIVGAFESHLADILVRRGRFADGVELVEHSIALHRDMGHRHELAWIYSILAEAEAHLGRYESARVHAKRAVTLSEETAQRWAVGYSRFTSGLAALGAQDCAEAHRSLSESISALQQMGHPEHLNCAISMSAYATRGLGRPVQAAGCLTEALKSATKIRTFIALLYALPAAALLLADRGEAERAVEVYALAASHPFVAHSHWFEAVAGRQVADAAAELPPAVVEAAQARGQALDPWQTAADLAEELSGLGALTQD
jgi:tetratricopeptide (TPR) repeat protein